MTVNLEEDDSIVSALNRIAENQEETNQLLARIGGHYDSIVPVMKRNAVRVEEAQEKAEKHYKYDFFYSTFYISTINHDGKQGLLNTGPSLPPEKKKKVYEAYHYFHDLPVSTQRSVYEHCRNNNDDWRSKSKEELQAIVGELSKV